MYLMIHSPNHFPDANDQNLGILTLGKSHFITYSQLRTELLGLGYDTNCYEYDLDYKYGNFNMRSDCLTWCNQNEVNKYCKTEAFVTSMHNLIRDKTLYHAPISTIGHCFLNDSQKKSELRSFCLKSCREDCRFTSYDKVKTIAMDENNTDTVGVFIMHNNMPDILIKSIPEITFISFVCNFGGLMGMWLGISILVIFDDVCKAIGLLISKRNVFNQMIFILHLHKTKTTNFNNNNRNVCFQDYSRESKPNESIFIKYKD